MESQFSGTQHQWLYQPFVSAKYFW